MEEGPAGESEGNGPMKPSKPSQKKAKPPKAPPPTERETTRAVLDRLRAHGIYSRKGLPGRGAKKGVADILGGLPGGRKLALEVETAKGRLP